MNSINKNINRAIIVTVIVAIILISEVYFYNKKFHVEIIHWFYTKGVFKTSLYLVSYASTLALYAVFFLIRDKIIFFIFLLALLISYYVTTCYVLINGYGFGLTEMQILSNEIGKHSTDALNLYGPSFILSALISIVILAFSIFLRRFVSKNELYIKNRVALVVALFAVITSFSIAFKTTNTITKFPTAASFYITTVYFNLNPTYYGQRDVLYKKPTAIAEYKNIIWIIDESVTAKHLSVNGYDKDTTPYLKSVSNKFVNLGTASSAANCSALSNIMLMSGIQLNQLPDSDNYSLKAPSIFQYANNAGYKTHYISGQSNDDVLQNNMTKFDLDSIDKFYQPTKSYTEGEIPEGDIIDGIKLALKNNKQNFIYVVKRGAHFQWEGKYPKQKSYFTPHLKKGDEFDFKNKEKAVNSYINLVKYRTDDFFKELFNQTQLLEDPETLIIYTSDHGQSILENEKKGTQCDSTDPNLSQGMVPLLIFENKNQDKFKSLGKNKFSHFEIFPTTLKLMGYEDHSNGKTFFNKKNEDRIFFSGDLFGRSVANFNKIEDK